MSDDPNESTVDVPLGGVGMMPPDIDVGPTSHDYGDVLVGTAASRTFVIRNLGDVALQVTTASLAGSDAGLFAIAQGGAPFTVAPVERTTSMSASHRLQGVSRRRRFDLRATTLTRARSTWP